MARYFLLSGNHSLVETLGGVILSIEDDGDLHELFKAGAAMVIDAPALPMVRVNAVGHVTQPKAIQQVVQEKVASPAAEPAVKPAPKPVTQRAVVGPSQAILEYLSDGESHTTKKIAEECDLTRDSCRSVLSQLQKRGKVRSSMPGNWTLVGSKSVNPGPAASEDPAEDPADELEDILPPRAVPVSPVSLKPRVVKFGR